MEGCNVEDFLCQIKVLESLRSLRTALGNGNFLSEFPELDGLDGKLVRKIETTEGDFRAALAKCGNVDLEIPTVAEFSEGEFEE